MDNFWIWLKRANARAVFFCLLAALLVTTGWWTWKLTTPIRVAPPPATAGTAHDKGTPGLGILDYLQAQQVVGTNRADNLFFPAEAFVQAPPPASKPEQVDTPKQEPRKDPGKTTPPRVTEMVTLTYRGLYVRGDGVTMASITDSKSQRTAFYSSGTNLFGVKITTIEAETLGVNPPDKPSVLLKRGIPQSFPENRHAD